MTPLRLLMTEDMQVRHFSPRTQSTYLLQVSLFARHFGQSPALLGPEPIRAYQLFLTNRKKMAPSSIRVAVAALRFLFQVTLQRGWNIEQSIPAPKQPRKLPIVASPEEVLQFLDSAPGLKYRAILTACYAAGLRVSEVVRLRPTDIDSRHQDIRVHQGKGRKDRYVMLSPRLLAVLRDYWRTHRPGSRHWLFPGASPAQPLTTKAVVLACHKALRRPPVQTSHIPLAATLLRRSPARSRHRHPHHSTPARSSQPLHHRPHPAPCRLQSLHYDQSTRPAPPAAIR